VSSKSILGNLLFLLVATFLAAQDSQTGAPAQPTSSVYNRMRRMQMSETGPHPIDDQPQNRNQQQTTRQFPAPASQFPPEQRGTPAPTQQQSNSGFPRAAQPGMQPSSTQPGAQTPMQSAAPQQNQAPYGLALQPANPPRISFSNGELTVLANNSSLSDIVIGIERAIGARVEGTPPDAERVFGQFGPASSRDVLNDLFTGSKYDFILVGGLDSPGQVQKIILSPHGTTPTVNTAANQPRQPQSNNDEDENDSSTQVSEAPSEAPNVQSEAPPQPPPSSGQSGQQQQQVKTPEQLLQELQRLRQQQQQQQPQQNPR